MPLFMPGDVISYIGEKFRDRLHGKKGWIHAPVVGNPLAFIVEFPDTRNSKDQKDTDDYIMPASSLTAWRPSPAEIKKTEGPEIQPRRRHKSAEEE